jgi:hypothetical protein
MNGVDTNNHLRRNMTVYRTHEVRNWRLLWYYTLNTCLTNSYLIWKGNSPDLSKNGHRKFREELSEELRNTPYSEVEKAINKRCYDNSMPRPNWDALSHDCVPLETRRYCVWCKEHAEEWVPKRPRRALTEIGNTRLRNRQSRSQYGCHSCGICLYRKGNCWDNYYSYNNTK